MDISAMKKDLSKALNMLPPGMVNPRAIVEWLTKNKPNIEVVFPQIMEILKPHFMAGAMESAMGTLDQDELEQAAVEVLLTHGIDAASVG